jgi:adenosylcobinamide-phosphate synthase
MSELQLYTTLAIATGVILDFILGDPHGWFHPICVIGNGISKMEKWCRKIFPASPGGLLAGGVCLVLVITVCSAGIPALFLAIAFHLHPLCYYVLASIMCYQIMATKALKDESMYVAEALENGDLEESRRRVSMIVGRDTANLTSKGVTKAAVETVAENSSDGCIAPLFYLLIGGPVLGFLYKSINTMDSMIGYKNEKYLYLGRAAAKLDDVVNYIPARLAALFMMAASAILRMDWRQAWRIYRRDRRKCSSPNAAQTESVCAGALDLELLGNAWYFGKLHEKPSLGDPVREIETADIRRANQLLYATAILFGLAGLLIRIGIVWKL